MLDFRPPLDNWLLIRLAKLGLPAIMRFGLNDTCIEVIGDGLSRFRRLSGTHTVICPNHAHHQDPQVMFAFSSLVGEDFNFLAAREIFDYDNGWNGFWLQHLGCYSVVRGASDRESFRTTRDLIVCGRKKLVIFPEGEISSQNDTLLPLESGVVQMSFWAQDELETSSRRSPVFILPVAVKYIYRRNIQAELEQSLWKLEDHLGIHAAPDESLYNRLRSVADVILTTLESKYNYKCASGTSLNDRIVGLRQAVLQNVASYLRISLPASAGILDWVRILRNSLDDFVYCEDVSDSPYHKKLHDEKAASIHGFYTDIERVVHFIAIYDGYLSAHMTQERFADVIDQLEIEVFGKTSAKGPRTVLIDVGSPINLLEFFKEYKNSKRRVIASVSQEISQQILSMLAAFDSHRQVILVK